MLIHLHKQATTTPKVRAAIQSSDEPASTLAGRFGTTEQTVYKWRHRDSVEDRSHTPHRLQTTLTPAQEAVAVALRTTLLVSLDDLLAVVREFLNPNASRSGLDRCLRRHGVGNLRDLKAKAPKPKHSAFKAYEPGYLHIDVKYLPHPLGTLLRNALPGSEWPIRVPAATFSWQSTERHAGSSSASSKPRQQSMPAASFVTSNALARYASAQFLRITSYARNNWLIWHQVIVMLKRSSTFECVSVRHFGQQRVSPITNTEYAHGGSHRP